MANLQNLSIKDLQRLVADLAKNPKSEEYSYKLIITNERDKISQIQSDSKDIKSRPFDVKDATNPSSLSSITDSELTTKLPPDVAGLVGSYTTVIESPADLRRLLLLDPSGRSAKQVLKDQTGKDLKVEAVLQILDAKYDTREEQYERYRDLVDLGLYYPAVKMFAENKYGFPASKEASEWKSDYLQKVMEQVLVVTDNLFDMAVDHEDLKLARSIAKMVSIESEQYPDVYHQGRSIGGRGILWWLTNGNEKQLTIIRSLNHYYFRSEPKDLILLEAAFNKAEEMERKDIASDLLGDLVDTEISSKSIIIGTVKYDFTDSFVFDFTNAINNGPSLEFTEAMAYIKSDNTLRKKAREMLVEYTEENPDNSTFSEANINRYL